MPSQVKAIAGQNRGGRRDERRAGEDPGEQRAAASAVAGTAVMVRAREVRTVIAVFLSVVVCALTRASTNACDSRHETQRKICHRGCREIGVPDDASSEGRSGPIGPHFEIRSTP